MTEILNLYGTLTLTLIGFIVPILTILISLFPGGTKALAIKYENERKQSEENIANETKKKVTEKGLDYIALRKTLAVLQRNMRRAEVNASYLKPVSLFVNTSVPFVVTFLAILLLLAEQLPKIVPLLLISSVLSFIAGVISLTRSISVLFEVAEIVNKENDSSKDKVIELLSLLVEYNDQDAIYLDDNAISIRFDKKTISHGSKFDFAADKKHEILVSVNNSGEKMAKNFELGFVFPEDILVEKTSNLSIYHSEKTQIIRFNDEMIYPHENKSQGIMSTTFLRAGENTVHLFIKGENVKYKKISFVLNIVS